MRVEPFILRKHAAVRHSAAVLSSLLKRPSPLDWVLGAGS